MGCWGDWVLGGWGPGRSPAPYLPIAPLSNSGASPPPPERRDCEEHSHRGDHARAGVRADGASTAVGRRAARTRPEHAVERAPLAAGRAGGPARAVLVAGRVLRARRWRADLLLGLE